MRSRILEAGWVEGMLGLLWLSSSLLGFWGGRTPVESLVADVAAFVCLLLVLRRMKIGTVFMVVVVAVNAGLDPDGRGLWIYIAMCSLAAVVRAGMFSLAAPATVCYSGALLWTSLQRAEPQQLPQVLASVVVLGAITWVVGLGFRAVRRAEEQRVTKELQAQQLGMAADMHDFVGRHLTNIIMRAELAAVRGGDSEDVLKGVAESARLANRALRQVTTTLRGSGHGGLRVGLDDALAQGVRDLEEAGFVVRIPEGLESTGSNQLREEMDLAAGRIMGEALHNVLKHGCLPGPVVVSTEVRAGALDLLVTNPITAQVATHTSGTGIEIMRRHAEVVGGQVDAFQSDGTWAVAASLPLPGGGQR